MATGDIKLQYPASSALTITFTALTQTGARQSIGFTNTASGFTDGVLMARVQTTTGTHGSDFACYLHGWAAPNDTSFTNPITTDSDVAITITTGMNLIGPAVVNFGTSVTGNYQAVLVIPSIANFFGGQLPEKFGFVLENKTNVTLSGTASNNTLTVFPTYENVST